MTGSTEVVHSHSDRIFWRTVPSSGSILWALMEIRDTYWGAWRWSIRKEVFVIKCLCLNSVQVKGTGLTAHGKHMFPHATQHGSSRIQEETSPGSSAYFQRWLWGMMHSKFCVLAYSWALSMTAKWFQGWQQFDVPVLTCMCLHMRSFVLQ